jgi:hypothetical protein
VLSTDDFFRGSSRRLCSPSNCWPSIISGGRSGSFPIDWPDGPSIVPKRLALLPRPAAQVLQP